MKKRRALKVYQRSLFVREMQQVSQGECKGCSYGYNDHRWPFVNIAGYPGQTLLCIKDRARPKKDK